MPKYGANWFFHEFKSKVCERDYGLAYRDNKIFTKKVTEAINEIIDKTGELKSQNEYFRIDITAYKSLSMTNEADNSIGMYPYLWDMMIAVEHENNEKDWSYEISKLTHVRCPLKVVIAYNHYDERETDMQKLDFAAKILQKSSTYKSMENDGEEWLVIIGNCRSRKNKDGNYTSFDYRGYVYSFSHKSFFEITASEG